MGTLIVYMNKVQRHFCLYVLAVCFMIPNLTVAKCFDTSCTMLKAGFGAYYAGFVMPSTIAFNGFGAHISANASRHWRWFVIGVDGGFGFSGVKAHTASTSTSVNFGSLVNIEPYIGVNLGSLENPIFVSLTLPVDHYGFGFAPNNNLDAMTLFEVGGALSGNIALAQGFGINFKLGYSYAYAGNYGIKRRNIDMGGLNQDPATIEVRDHYKNHTMPLNGAHIWELALGTTFEREYAEYSTIKILYAYLKCKYYTINAPNSAIVEGVLLEYSYANNFVTMLELGVGF